MTMTTYYAILVPLCALAIWRFSRRRPEFMSAAWLVANALDAGGHPRLDAASGAPPLIERYAQRTAQALYGGIVKHTWQTERDRWWQDALSRQRAAATGVVSPWRARRA